MTLSSTRKYWLAFVALNTAAGGLGCCGCGIQRGDSTFRHRLNVPGFFDCICLASPEALASCSLEVLSNRLDCPIESVVHPGCHDLELGRMVGFPGLQVAP